VNQRLANLLGQGETRPPKSFRTSNQNLLTTKTLSEGKPALSGDGKLLLYISTNPDDNEKTADGKIKTFGDLFVKNIATGDPVQITHQENPSGDLPVFTADNNFVVFSNYPKANNGGSLPNLYKVASSGGRVDKKGEPLPMEAKPVPFIREASGAGFSPDGRWVAYTKHLSGRKVLWLSNAGDPESDHKEIAAYGFTPRWSADGKWLAYTTSNPNGGVGDIWVMDAASFSNPRNVTNEPQQIYGLTWTPDSRFLIFSSKRTGPSLLWRVPFEGGSAEPVTGPDGDFSTPSMSREGNMLVYSRYHGAQNVFIAEGLDAEARNLTYDEYHEDVRLSPSGQLLASVMQQPDFGEHLYLTDLSGNHTCLSKHASHHPTWFGEKKVIYLRWDQSNQQTEVIEVDVTDLKNPVAKPLKPFQGKTEWLDVNPADETKLVVVVTTGEKQQIVLCDLATDQQLVIASGLEYAHLRWSPDGSSLAWSGPPESGKESAGIWVIKPKVETQPQRIVPEGFGPVWAANNAAIYFAKVGSQSGLFEYDLRTSKERKRRDWKQTAYFDVVGNRLVYCELGSSGQTRVYSRSVE
jgi:Tol biopolymer transport system component